MEGCVELGAEKRKARLWGHHEHSSSFIDRIRAERTDWVDDFEEEIAVFTQIVITGDDGQSYHPFCKFSIWDDGCIRSSEGAVFGLLNIEHCSTLAAA